MPKRRSLRMWALPAFGALVLLLPASAQATFPGENGRIVFRCGGTCATDPEGTVVTRLTSGRHYEQWPSYSADGRWITFSRRYREAGIYEVMVMRADGSGVRRVTRSRRSVFNVAPVFTPDGERIVFQRSGPGIQWGIYVMELDGSGKTRIGDGRNPQVSPDGSTVVFSRDKEEPDELGYPQLFTMDIDGSDVTPLTSADPEASARHPEWSPDGERILMTYFDFNVGTPPWVQGIFTIRPDGTGLIRLSSEEPPNAFGTGWIQEATFSPDGHRFAAAIQDRCPDKDCQYSLYIMGIDGSYDRRLFDLKPGDYPDWGPAIEGDQAPTGRCRGQRATIVGSDRDDVITGTPQTDVIVARGGDDLVSGAEGNDVVCGGPGGDLIRGGIENDKLYGQRGADRIEGFAGRDRLFGGNGGDSLSGGKGRDRCRGGRGSDTLRQCER